MMPEIMPIFYYKLLLLGWTPPGRNLENILLVTLGKFFYNTCHSLCSLLPLAEYVYHGSVAVSNKEQQDRLTQLLQQLGMGASNSIPAAAPPLPGSCEQEQLAVKADISWLEDLADVERTFQIMDAEESKQVVTDTDSIALPPVGRQKFARSAKSTAVRTTRKRKRPPRRDGKENLCSTENTQSIASPLTTGTSAESPRTSVAGDIGSTFACELCDKAAFATSKELAAHAQAEHGDAADNGLRCKFCTKLFGKLAAKRAHERFHTKPHKCAECDASFGRRSNLVGHVRIHRGERPFVCDQCGKGFPLASSLQTHKKQSHAVGSKSW